MGHGLKYTWRDLMTVLKVKGVGVNPAYLLYLMTNIYNILEDVFSVGSVEEIQEAIDEIGTDSGTLFIESGMYDITVPIDIDNCGSIVIYGHGDNTILKPADGITVFNITCCSSLLVKTLKIDASNYTAPNINVPLVLVNETLDNVVSFQDVTIEGLNNFGRGIELQSNNCIIENCNITFLSYGINVISDSNIISQNTASLNEIGINVAGSYCTITGNTCSSNTILGIYLNSAIYDNVSNNICNINPTGISLNLSSNNTIANNIASSNTFNGIYLSGSSYNTLSGNTCENNDSNTAGNTAGIHILANSDFNTISANSSNNNNNAGAGTAYGIYIAAATCDENVIASNNTNGNDVDLMDAGTATTVEYYVQDEWELQDAIDSIGTKAGVINIDASFTINAPITILGGGSYIIQGEGSNSTLTTGDNQCFNITSARSVLLQNFKIDVSAITGRNTVIIEVDEAADNLVVIDNIEIVGIVARGWGVDVVSDYVQIRNCNFSTIDMGIHISGNNCKAESNVLNGMDEYGIDCIGDYAIIINNTCNSSNVCGIQMNGGSYCNVSQNQCHSNANYGIFVFSLDNMVLADNICTLNDAGIKIEDSNYVSVSNNTSSSNTTTGIMITGTSSNNIVLGNTCDNNAAGYGIIIGAATCVDNIVKSNNTSGNNWNLWDLGTNSDFEYRCSTEAEIQNALDSIAAKSGIIEILTGIINITGTINIDGNGLYIIKGNGDGTILTPSGDFSVFDITSCISCVLRDFKIDSQNIVSNDTNIIDINEDNVFIEKVNIVGDADKKGYGIYVETGKTDIKISYCNISYCYIGIYYLGIGCSISNNIINYCSNDGIYVYGTNTIVSENIISYCNIVGNAAGIHVLDDYVIVNGNICHHNGHGILLGTIISGVNNNVSSNICYSNDGHGIFLTANDSNQVEGNFCYSNVDCGIALQSGASKNTIVGNHCTSNGFHGILLDDSNYNTITGNSCNSNTKCGIEVADNTPDYNTVIANTCNNNTTFGIDMLGAGNGNIIGANMLQNNITANFRSGGAGTIILGDDTVYGIGWNNDKGTATKNAIYDKIEAVIAGAGGEVNTASNQGTGIGLFWQKLVADLQFNNLKSENNRLSIALDGASHDVEFTIVEANIDHNALANYNALRHLLVGAIDHNLLLNYAANRHYLENTINLANINEKNHASLANILANQHHAPTVAGDLNLNDLLEKNHISLANKNAEANIQHLTAAQVAALHAIYTNASAVQAVEDAGLVLSAGKIIEFDGTPADGIYTGFVMNIDTTGCAVFDAVYVDGANSVAKAQATGIATMPAIGVVVAAGKVLTHGAIRSNASWAWAAGAVIYINETVAGELDDAIPAVATELVQIMGVATEADTIFVNPSLDWVVRK